MKIHIFGASGSGVTSLGKTLSEQLAIPYFDSDDFFWHKTEPPYIQRREPEVRNQLLKNQLESHDNWILGGSVLKWGEIELSPFDLAVFLYIPHEIRMERLKNREFGRYGSVIYENKERNQQYMAFMEWASGYDDNSTDGRNLAAHESWIQTLSCPLLELRGDFSVSKRVDAVLTKLETLNDKSTY